MVYVGQLNTTSNGAEQGSLEALARSTGKALWRTPTNSSDLYLPLALGDGALYVSKIAASAPTPAVSQRFTLQALNATTGATLWIAPIDVGLATSAALDGGSLYLLTRRVGAASNTQIGLTPVNARTGAIRWQKALQDAAAGTPAVANGILYAAEETPPSPITPTPPSPIVEAINASTGASLWRRTLAGQPEGEPLMANSAGVVTVVQIPPASSCVPPPVSKSATPTPEPVISPCEAVTTLLHLSAATGAQTWSAPLTGTELSSAPRANASAVYMSTLYGGAGGNPSGAIEAYSLANGKLIWRHAVAEGISNSIELSGATLYLEASGIVQGPSSQSVQSTLEALSATDGSLLWKKPLGVEQASMLVAVSAA